MSAQEAAQFVTDEFESDFAIFKEKNAAVIGALEAEGLVSGGSADDFFYDLTDNLKGHLGAEAANRCDDGEDEQDQAIALVENFVAEQVANSAENAVALALWLNGPSEGEKLLRDRGKADAPSPT